MIYFNIGYTFTALTNAQVCVDGGVSGRARQVLVLPVGNVLVGAGIAVFLGQTKVNYIHEVALLAEPHQEVVRLNVTVDEVFAVDVFYASDLKKN